MKIEKISSNLNPNFMFYKVDSHLLIMAIEGQLSLVDIAKSELIRRGKDKSGRRISFEEARNLYK